VTEEEAAARLAALLNEIEEEAAARLAALLNEIEEAGHDVTVYDNMVWIARSVSVEWLPGTGGYGAKEYKG
jgi:hypothetical protein